MAAQVSRRLPRIGRDAALRASSRRSAPTLPCLFLFASGSGHLQIVRLRRLVRAAGKPSARL